MTSIHPYHSENALKSLFSFYDALSSGYISNLQLQRLHEELRFGGISMPQVEASLEQTNVESNRIFLADLPALLKEMDRRYYLIQDLQWEFAMLDCNHTGLVPIKSARFLMEARHGHSFSETRWKKFLAARPVPHAQISFADMEVELCNIMHPERVLKIEESHPLPVRQVKKKEQKEDKRVDETRRLNEEEERRRRVELESKKQKDEDLSRKEDEKNKQTNGGTDHVEEKEQVRAKQQEHAPLKDAKKEASKDTGNAPEDAHKKRIRSNLKVALESPDRQRLTKTTNEFKEAKLSDDDGDLKRAERLLTMFKCSDTLKDGISKRLIETLESGLATARKNGFHRHELSDLVTQADELLLRLRRLERLRHEVLELKSSTIAEIRSYAKPPPIVHNVMIATYLLLGTSETETKKWKNVQVLLAKTGREGLKRRIMQLKVTDVNKVTANKARAEIADTDLEIIRDVSAGAATFYVWVDGMVEEVLSI